ncbi:MAG: DsbA family protein [Anaerolineae bacterium]|jgi:protein-disulfide isomerase|nr:DsbA family protein [Anaerolineae bacterium]MBT4312553.1 DsbA family protein [Anaerolineae bacterium]MBT4457676.1 DsbA family protein [Anaerolineae bacterium]MBT4841171.1 DsbA family protein [Anaerolineae bacterium]MBT6062362.1 DsbA family protein [Anaerolineae bacterium]
MSKPKSKKQLRREKVRAEKERKKWMRYGAIGLVLVAIVAFIVTRPPKAPPLDEARLASNPSIGLASAKVTVTEFGDFGCHACQSWHESGIKEQIIATYGDDVQFVWKDFPVITAQSPKAAEAGQCAFDQGEFWAYHDLLYAKAPAIGVSNLKEYAAQVGLDTARFDACLDSGQNRAKAELSEREARQLALPGTPAFLVNGTRLIGPPSFEVLAEAIDAVLAE